jgi:flagellar protein FliO/FliZ
METLFLALRVIVALAVVLAIIWVVQRRLGKGASLRRAKNVVSVVGRTSIGPKATVAVVEVEGARLVLGVTEHGISVLHELDAAAAPDAAFARELSAVTALPARAPAPRPATPAPRPATPAPRPAKAAPRPAPGGAVSPLAGSILSPDTWRAASTALRRAR